MLHSYTLIPYSAPFFRTKLIISLSTALSQQRCCSLKSLSDYLLCHTNKTWTIEITLTFINGLLSPRPIFLSSTKHTVATLEIVLNRWLKRCWNIPGSKWAECGDTEDRASRADDASSVQPHEADILGTGRAGEEKSEVPAHDRPRQRYDISAAMTSGGAVLPELVYMGGTADFVYIVKLHVYYSIWNSSTKICCKGIPFSYHVFYSSFFTF